MKTRTVLQLSALVLCLAAPEIPGAAFQNLDFEDGDLVSPPIDIGPDGIKSGPVTRWLPHWRLFVGQADLSELGGTIPLNRPPMGDTYSLYDENYIAFGPLLEGNLAFVAGRPSGSVISVSLVQEGEIPSDARSLHYKAQKGSWEVRINGVSLDLYGWDSTDTSRTLQDVSVDVTPWAGQEVELKLTKSYSPPRLWNALDSIRFSSEPVIPEPSKGGLFVVGAAVFGLLGAGWRRIKGGRSA